MFKASEKEYEVLKDEVKNIRDCITQYLSYIIGLSAITGIIVNIVIDDNKENDSLYIMILLLVTLFIITLLFDIVWYKFKSHNRFVGYIQLILQEVGHGVKSEIPQEDYIEKKYLDTFQNKCKGNAIDLDENLYSWEFIMSRYNTASFHGMKGKLLKATEQSDFVFVIPEYCKYEDLRTEPKVDSDGNNGYSKLDNEFFDKIIYHMYGEDEKEQKLFERFKHLILDILKFPKLLLFTYSPVLAESYSIKEINIDKKYLSSSWLYPKKVTQIVFIPVLFLCIAIFFMFFNFVLTHNWQEFSITSLIPPIILLLCLICFAFWIKRYLVGLNSIIKGKYSIEYYCWTFFVFRVQLLNSKGIIPIYFSRSFIRYFKSKILHNSISNGIDIFKASDNECVMHNATDLNEVKSGKNRLCEKCLNEYLDCLTMFKKFDEKQLKIHQILNCEIKDLKIINNEQSSDISANTETEDKSEDLK